MRSSGPGDFPFGQALGQVHDLVDREAGVGVGEHRSLRRAGRARRVDQRHHVVRLRFGHPSLDRVGVDSPVRPSQFEEILPGHQSRVVVLTNSARFEVDDLAQRSRCLPLGGEHLVDLLLVLGEMDDGRAVAEKVRDLDGGVGGIQADGDAAHGDGGQVEDDPLGAVLGVDRHSVTGLDAECQQSMADVEHLLPYLLPRVLVPDAEVLLPHRRLSRMGARPLAGKRGDGGIVDPSGRRLGRQRRCGHSILPPVPNGHAGQPLSTDSPRVRR